MNDEIKAAVDKAIASGKDQDLILFAFRSAGLDESYIPQVEEYIKKKRLSDSTVSDSQLNLRPSVSESLSSEYIPVGFSTSEIQQQKDAIANAAAADLYGGIIQSRGDLRPLVERPEFEESYRIYRSLSDNPAARALPENIVENGQLNTAALPVLKQGAINYASDLLKKEQERQKELGAKFTVPVLSDLAAGGEQVIGGVLKFADMLGGRTGELADFFIDDSAQRSRDALIDYGLTEDEIAKGFIGNLSEGNFKAGLISLGSTLIQQAPQLVVAAAAGPYGLAALGTSAAGSQYADIQNRSDLTANEKLLYAVGVGTAEYITERLFMGDVNMLRKAFTKEGVEAMTKKELGDMLFGFLPKGIRAVTEEGTEEVIASVAQQTLGKFIAGDEIDPIEIAESAIIGGLMGGSAYVASRGINALDRRKDLKAKKEAEEYIKSVEQKLADPNISEAEKEILRKTRTRAVDVVEEIKRASDRIALAMTEEERQEVINIQNEIARASARHSEHQTQEAKDEEINRIKELIDRKTEIESKYDIEEEAGIPSGVVKGEAVVAAELIVGEGEKAPEAGGVLQVPTEERPKVIRPEEAKSVTEISDQIVRYKKPSGEEISGTLLIDEGGKVSIETDTEIFEVGNVAELEGTTPTAIGISRGEIELQDDGSYVAETKRTPYTRQSKYQRYTNTKENKLDAITRDEQGNVQSVVLTDDNGVERTFTGPSADYIAYNTILSEATPQQLQQADEAARQILEQPTEVAPEAAGKAVEPAVTAPAGARIFNEPLQDAETIASGYAEGLGLPYEKPPPVTSVNEERAKRIAQAFDEMVADPKNTKVKAAYEAMAKETLDQFQAILDQGYTIEINNTEPYANSQEMIDDLRENKRMKIFSTEFGFGDEAITQQQRKENPLLRDSGFKDSNGQTLLVNDVFRFVHDFFGHAKLGNGFGAIGEENAWRVHSRMYTPLARLAMTTETRGQNSWVNFSGINEEAFRLRDEARRLRAEGRTEEAAELLNEVYEKMRFAEQKIGLLPQEFSMTDEEIQAQAAKPRVDRAQLQKSIEKAQRALKKLLPNVDIPFILHNTREEFNAAMDAVSRNGAIKDAIEYGRFIPSRNEIHINLQDADIEAPLHEAFHAVFLLSFPNMTQARREKLAKDFEAGLKKVLKSGTAADIDLMNEMDRFVKEGGYTAEEAPEEFSAQLAGFMGANYMRLSKPTQNKLIQWINSFIGKFFPSLKIKTPNEFVDFMNSFAAAANETTEQQRPPAGQPQTDVDITFFPEEKSSKNASKDKFGFIRSYLKDNDKFEKLKEEGYISEGHTIDEFYDLTMILHAPDNGFTGNIAREVKHSDGTVSTLLIVRGKGGVFYPLYFHEKGYFWASTETAAKSLAAKMNKAAELGDGTIRLMLISGNQDKLLSSSINAQGVIDILESKAFADEMGFTKNELKKSLVFGINDLLDRKKSGDSSLIKVSDANMPKRRLKQNESLEDVLSFVRDFLTQDNSIFASRKRFIQSTLDGVSKSVKSDKTTKQFRDFLGIETQGGKISSASLTEGFSRLLTEPMLDGVLPNMAYAVLEIKGPVEAIKTEAGKGHHESYPSAIVSQTGEKTYIKLLKHPYNWMVNVEDLSKKKEFNLVDSPSNYKKILPTTSGMSEVVILRSPDKAGKIVPEEKSSKKQLGIDVPYSDIPLYHGSKAEFAKFDMSKAGGTDEGFLGRAIYLTADYENAQEYGPYVNTFYADIKNALVIEDPYSFGGVNPKKIRSILGLSEDASAGAVTKALKEAGYDAVIINEIGGTDMIEVAIYDPSIIKSKEEKSSKRADAAKEQLNKLTDKAKETGSKFMWSPVQKAVRVFKETQTSQMSREGMKINNFAKRLNKLLSKADQETLDLVNNVFDGTLTPELQAKLIAKPNGDAIYTLSSAMRSYIDEFAVEFLADPAFLSLPQELKETIADNFGQYMRGSYRFWKDKKFTPSEAALNDAIEFEYNIIRAKQQQELIRAGVDEATADDLLQELASEAKREAKEKVNAYIADITRLRDSKGFRFTGLVNPSSIKLPSQQFLRRKELPDVIERLLGKEKDPLVRFVDTAIGVSNIKYKGHMISSIYDMLGDTEMIKDSVTRAEEASGEFKQVKDAYSPIDGKFVHKDIFEAIIDVNLYQSDVPFFQAYFNILKLARKSKVIYNIPTWRKNLTGGWYTMMANGVINPQVLSDLKRRGDLFIKGETDAETEALLDIMAEFGLIGQDVNANIIGFTNIALTRPINGTDEYYKSGYDRLVERVKGVDKKLGQLYASVDDYTKLVIFRQELNSYALKLKGKEYESLNEDDKKEVQAAAAESVKRTTPTFSRLPKFYTSIAKTPIGDFLSFELEALRSMGENILIGMSDVNKGMKDKELSATQKKAYISSGVKRLSGAATVLGARLAVPAILASLSLGDDDDLKESIEALRPNWMEGHSIIPVKIDENGIATVYDYSMEDPYGSFFDLTTDPSTFPAYITGLARPNMGVQFLMNIIEGKDIYGKEIVESYDSNLMKGAKYAGYTLKSLVVPPFIASSVRDEMRRYDKEAEKYDALDAVGRVTSRTAIRDYQYNVGSQFYYFAKELGTGKKQYSDLSGTARGNRLAELDEVKKMYNAIVQIGVSKGNPEMIKNARNVVKRNYEALEEAYILNGFKLKE